MHYADDAPELLMDDRSRDLRQVTDRGPGPSSAYRADVPGARPGDTLEVRILTWHHGLL